ncbi:MAG: DoxX family protein [Chryseolinea sp.]
MKTTTFDLTLLFTRLLIAVVIFGHGAQKLFGWFGGYGFDDTVGYFTTTVGLPYLIAVLIIMAESLGMVALAIGLFSRFIAGAVIAIMLGAIVVTHAQYGFYMNWFGAQQGEGIEYHLLMIGLSIIIAVNGGGAYSVDPAFRKLIQSLTGKSSVQAIKN